MAQAFTFSRHRNDDVSFDRRRLADRACLVRSWEGVNGNKCKSAATTFASAAPFGSCAVARCRLGWNGLQASSREFELPGAQQDRCRPERCCRDRLCGEVSARRSIRRRSAVLCRKGELSLAEAAAADDAPCLRPHQRGSSPHR